MVHVAHFAILEYHWENYLIIYYPVSGDRPEDVALKQIKHLVLTLVKVGLKVNEDTEYYFNTNTISHFKNILRDAFFSSIIGKHCNRYFWLQNFIIIKLTLLFYMAHLYYYHRFVKPECEFE